MYYQAKANYKKKFLRRLEKSKYAENHVLKGGLFIYSVTEARRFPDTVTEFIYTSLITSSVSCASSAICATLQIFFSKHQSICKIPAIERIRYSYK